MASCDEDRFSIRPLKEDECGQVVAMIEELAEFEKMGDQVNIMPDGLRKDIFDEPQRCWCLVAENEMNKELGVVAYALYYFAYSTFERTYLHLEDLYVKPDFRRKGIGKRLYQACTQVAVDLGFQRVELEVLGWNKPAKDFYERIGNKDMSELEGWHKMRLNREQMEKFVKM